MDLIAAQTLSQKLQISLEQVVREEYEILLLKEIFESEFGANLVFKGGTALRLVYNSPRFSEDLDFTLIKDFDREGFISEGKNSFTSFLKELEHTYPAIISVEAKEKYYTIFGLIKIKEDYLNLAFSIKVEVSKRKGEWIKDKDYSDKIIRSEVTPLTVLVQVAQLERILEEKEDAIKNRKAPRDIFDYWYINQLLKKEVKVRFEGYDKTHTKAELHRLLSRTYWRIIDSWLE
ncbi:hypothetical protein A3C26_02150 [Candidatus Daviesbacteria bacterium RIFCSPHIGHO2_02_FULL_39_12]|uniref:Nucleotidyl transferase AbiEii/AbiGii toxin family protein n=1 Tax=Candidatus Daviesbacteria bacterium RIFCSPHIGHO2_02_FULL_39_12 TaxID=1797770 RepID=A0A1F5J901_9BACT|nr:MAG: hypothetical protein A3C26_02150 [Candidatus Daviesbacteria bacterium RIFCSPHIGHO2_02_FULL_39_12]